MPGSSKIELLHRARAGDENALSELLAQVEPLIYRFGLKLCRHPEDAKGVLQETMLSLVQAVDSFREESSLSTWLYAIARSHCARKRRKSAYAPEHIGSLETELRAASTSVPAEEPSPAEELERRRLEAALSAAIRSLDDKYRDVLVLRDIEGLTAPQVGEVMGLSVAAVKSRLHRARSTLRERMAKALGEKPEAALPAAAQACPDVADLLSRKLEGELSPRVCEEMEAHVTTCPRCKNVCDSLQTVLRACKASAIPKVPEDIDRAVRTAVRSALKTQD